MYVNGSVVVVRPGNGPDRNLLDRHHHVPIPMARYVYYLAGVNQVRVTNLAPIKSVNLLPSLSKEVSDTVKGITGYYSVSQSADAGCAIMYSYPNTNRAEIASETYSGNLSPVR